MKNFGEKGTKFHFNFFTFFGEFPAFQLDLGRQKKERR